MIRLNFDFKLHRAILIASVFKGKKMPIVCLTCGNAAVTLRMNCDGEILELGPGVNAVMKPNKWLRPHEVAQMFPNHFDATSGHLPFWMLVILAGSLREKESKYLVGEDKILVPSGSGESAVIAKLAFPRCTVIAQFDNSKPSTTFNQESLMYLLFEPMGIISEFL